MTMFSKHTSGTIAIFLATILLAGMSIGFPAMRNANAAINVGQATVPTNICGANANPVLCSNTGGNLVVVNPATDANQAIDVTGSQLITPTNECDDDGG